MPPPRVIGHRGAAGHAPENTLAGLRRAAALGVRWVEFDVKLSRDGHPILFHDQDLERTTNGRGPVAATDLADLRRLDAGAWFGAAYRGEPIPTLDEALAALAAHGLGANVEIKPCPGRAAETAEIVVRQLRAAWPAGLPPPLVSSFDEAALAVARDLAPELDRALIVGAVPADWPARLERLGCGALHCGHRDLTAATAAAVTAAGITLRCFTVNTRTRAETLFAWGAASVFSDRPDRLL